MPPSAWHCAARAVHRYAEGVSAAIELTPELDAALRQQLREGETVAYARQPRMQRDVTMLLRIWRFDTETVAALTMSLAGCGALVQLAIDSSGATKGIFEGKPGLLLAIYFGIMGALNARTSIRARRANRHTVYAVTNQRVLRITTWPRLEVAAWEAAEVTEVTRHNVKPDCGNIRYLKGVPSHDGNALMYVPMPEACEAAMRALISKPTLHADGRA